MTSQSRSEQTAVLDVNGTKVPYSIRRSRRARCLRITLNAQNGLTLVLPQSTTIADGKSFLNQKTGWIGKHLQHVKAEQQRRIESQHALPASIPYQGRDLPITAHTGGKQAKVHLNGSYFRVIAPDTRTARLSLMNWLRRQAELVLPERLKTLAAALEDVNVQHIQVRDQKSRWGSCARSGTISLNWRLIMLPPDVADYVILHELVHVTHPHHQQTFWGALRQLCPDCDRHRHWLRHQGCKIMQEWSRPD